MHIMALKITNYYSAKLYTTGEAEKGTHMRTVYIIIIMVWAPL